MESRGKKDRNQQAAVIVKLDFRNLKSTSNKKK